MYAFILQRIFVCILLKLTIIIQVAKLHNKSIRHYNFIAHGILENIGDKPFEMSVCNHTGISKIFSYAIIVLIEIFVI